MSVSIRRLVCTTAVAVFGVSISAFLTSPAAGLTCATPPDGAELAIRSGWPEAAPFEFVVIATIRDITPANGDASTWGEVLEIHVEAVLRGDLPMSTSAIFNPPLGASGWPGFRAGAQFLIAANPNFDGTDGQLSTSLCAPNEEITSAERFDELVSFSAEPRLSDTALPTNSALPWWGVALLLLSLTIGVHVRRNRRSDDSVH